MSVITQETEAALLLTSMLIKSQLINEISKELSHLPIIVDPSHGTGKREVVSAMSRAALAAGADGIMVETHPDPLRALSDGAQALTFEMFEEMMSELVRIGDAINRPVLVEAFDGKSEVRNPLSEVRKIV